MQTIQQVLESKNPQLSLYKREFGVIHTRALVVLFIVDLIEFFNVGKSMSAQQIASTADMIIEEYWWYKPDDFKLCFKLAKTGKINGSKLYDRIDGSIIMEWLASYDVMRVNESIAIREQEAKLLKTQEVVVNYEDVKNNINKEVGHKNKLEQEFREKQRKAILYNRLYHLWEKQFNRRYSKVGKEVTKIKFVPYQGAYIHLNGFLSIKKTKVIDKLLK